MVVTLGLLNVADSVTCHLNSESLHIRWTINVQREEPLRLLTADILSLPNDQMHSVIFTCNNNDERAGGGLGYWRRGLFRVVFISLYIALFLQLYMTSVCFFLSFFLSFILSYLFFSAVGSVSDAEFMSLGLHWYITFLHLIVIFYLHQTPV